MENPPLASSPPPTWEVGEVLFEFEAADSESGDYITVVDDVRAVAGSGVWVADGRSPMVIRARSDGSEVEVIGREGDGPGEYRSPSSILSLPDGRVGVWDGELDRVTVWSADGDAEGSFRTSPEGGFHGLEGAVRPFGPGSAGALLAVHWERPPEEGRIRFEGTIYRLDLGERTADTLFQAPGDERFVELDVDVDAGVRNTLIYGAPFGARVQVVMSQDLVVYADGSENLVETRDPTSGAIVRRIETGLRRMPVAADAFDLDREAFAAVRLEPVTAFEDMWEDRGEPGTVPAFGEVRAGPGGELWLGEYVHSPANARRWWIYDAAGTRIGTVRLPEGFVLQDPGRERLLGFTRDEQETERVAALELYRTHAVGSGTAHGQDTLRWANFDRCEDCSIELEEIVRFGEKNGPGVVESILPRVVAHADRGFLVHGSGGLGGTRLALFDTRGTFVRAFGREGQGPGEFQRLVSADFLGARRVVAVDSDGRWSVFHENGELLSTFRVGDAPAGPMTTLEERAIVGARGYDPHNAGQPLHRVDLEDGEAEAHFGRGVESWRSEGRFQDHVHLVKTPAGSERIWWGSPLEAHLEEWGVDGQHHRTLTGTLQWLPDWADNEFPNSTIEDLAIDERDRIWILSEHPSPDWEEVDVSARSPEAGYTIDQADEIRDVRLDVYDLEEERHLGTREWERPLMRFIVMGGRVLLYAVAMEETPWPRIVVYEPNL